jgi:uncharacterized protein (DUF433 family)
VITGQPLPEYPEVRMVERTALGLRPVMVGTRLEVRHIVELVQEPGGSEEEAAAYLEVDPAVVAAAMRYYRDHREQIDAWILEAHESSARAYAEWLRDHGHNLP